MVVPTNHFYLAFQTRVLDDKLGAGHEIMKKKSKIWSAQAALKIITPIYFVL